MVCCEQEADCTGSAVGYDCNTDAFACYETCDEPSDDKCADGYHCETGDRCHNTE